MIFIEVIQKKTVGNCSLDCRQFKVKKFHLSTITLALYIYIYIYIYIEPMCVCAYHFKYLRISHDYGHSVFKLFLLKFYIKI